MKSKAYLGPIITRAIAVLLLVLSLAYAGFTAYDVLRAPTAPKGEPSGNAAPSAQQKAEDEKAAETARKAREKATATIMDTMEACRSGNAAWYACKEDAECHMVIGVCGMQDAANRQFTAQASECYNAAGADMSCPPFERVRGSGACVKGVCVLEPAKTSPPLKRETFTERMVREMPVFPGKAREAAPEEK